MTLLSELTLTDDLGTLATDYLDQNLRELERRYLSRRSKEIQQDIVEAEKGGDPARVDQLIAEKAALNRNLNTLK